MVWVSVSQGVRVDDTVDPLLAKHQKRRRSEELEKVVAVNVKKHTAQKVGTGSGSVDPRLAVGLPFPVPDIPLDSTSYCDFTEYFTHVSRIFLGNAKQILWTALEFSEKPRRNEAKSELLQSSRLMSWDSLNRIQERKPLRTSCFDLVFFFFVIRSLFFVAFSFCPLDEVWVGVGLSCGHPWVFQGDI